ncbi:hypothetical protein, partial [Bradyrhizobium sp.]|uniref:hypothetical protein n=1 Tax=Bradyrhizobium sp. TaxID=376 RepID=UPI003C638A75
MENKDPALDSSTGVGRVQRAKMAPKHVMRVANAIYSNFLTERSDQVFFIRSLDFLLIALEEHFAIQATSSDEHRTFESCNSKGMLRGQNAVQFPGGVELRVLCERRQDEAGCYGQLDEATSLLARIAHTLEEYAEGRVVELGNRMNKAINALVKKEAMEEPRDVAFEDSAESRLFFDRFFERLDSEIQSASDLCFFPNDVTGTDRCLRLFFFHRRAPGDAYSMHLHPLASQKKSAGAQYLKLSADGVWRFDDVVGKGLVNWIRWPWDDAERGVPTSMRRFKDYLDQLTVTGKEAPGETSGWIAGCKGLAVPLHFGGSPWLVALVVFSGREEDYGELAYYLCRAVVPTLFDTIAHVARGEYLRLIAEHTKASFTGRFDADALNSLMSRMAALSPYQWYLSSERTKWPISAFKETFYLNERPILAGMDPIVFDFRRIRSEEVRDAIQSAAREAENEVQQQKESQRGADEGIGHTLKNIVDLTNWPTALAKLRNLIRNYDRLVADDRHDEIRGRLYEANRCMGLFSLVSGLGHFGRLAGALDREEYEKFNDWLDPDGLGRWTSGDTMDERRICGAYIDTIYRVVASLCASLDMDREPQKFEVICASTSVQWDRRAYNGSDQDDHGQFDKFLLEIPPFRRGSDAVYSFIFALMEPLVNALRALEQLRDNQALSSSEHLLRIFITPKLPEEIEFSITNPCVSKVQATLSGFEKTRHMLRRIGIAEIEDLEFRPTRPGVYDVTARVHFKPYGLALRIAQ